MPSTALQALVRRGGEELGGQQVRAEIEVFDLLAASFKGEVLDKLNVATAIVADQHSIADKIQ